MTRWVDGWQRVVRTLLPARCLLCAAPGVDDVDLCAACRADLPRNTSCCARCAEPLPQPAALCGHCQNQPPPWDAAWAPFRYDWPLDRLETRFKFAANLACGRTLAGLWCDGTPPIELPQAVLPVPLHAARLRQRGYNQALELARPLARHFGVRLLGDALLRQRATTAQTELDRRARLHNVRGAFTLRAGVALPEHVAILDDVMTTGATLAECSRVLRQAGVTRVDVWALARAPAPRA